MIAPLKPQDAPPRHWTDRLPPKLTALAQLSRLDRPVGWRLLLLPCLMGLAVVRIEDGFWAEDLRYSLLFLIGAIAMRGAGCAYNDILDAAIDAKVARTAARPIPSGRLSKAEAWAWVAAQCGVGLLVLAALPPIAQVTALAAIPLVAAYPLMKRITWWPQAWLGLTFSWGALVGGAAANAAPQGLPQDIAAWPREIPLENYLLYTGCIAWTVAYDTVYALQDREDDALVGVRSTARLFGDRWKAWTLGFYVSAVFLWAAAAATAGAGIWVMALFCAIGAFGVYPLVDRINAADPSSALKAFKANQVIGLAVLAALAAEPLWRMAP
jgi:4-hydroxybenzoate polyprenyltransferase